MQRYRDTGGPRTLATFWGFELTFWQMIGIGSALVVAGAIIWFGLAARMGGVKPLILISARVVNAEKAMHGLKALEPPDSNSMTFTFGGNDELSLIRYDPSGAFLLVEIDIKRTSIWQHADSEPAGFMLDAATFELRGGQGTAAATYLANAFAGNLEIDLTMATCNSSWDVLPNIDHANERDEGGRRLLLDYDGTNGAEGTLSIPANEPEAARSTISARGQVQWKSPAGANVDFDYGGHRLFVRWDSRTHGWLSAQRIFESTRPTSSPYRRLVLLFHRPRRSAASDLGLYVGGELMATLSPSLAAREPQFGTVEP